MTGEAGDGEDIGGELGLLTWMGEGMVDLGSCLRCSVGDFVFPFWDTLSI